MPLCNHLILDGHAEAFKRRQGQADLVHQLLSRLVALVGMTEMDSPYVATFSPWNYPREQWGNTGIVAIVPLQESHIALHTWWDTGAFWFDLCSCKAFDPKKVENWLVKEYEVVVAKRWRLRRHIGGQDDTD